MNTQSRPCPQCGAISARGARFCGQCGSRIAQAESSQQRAVEREKPPVVAPPTPRPASIAAAGMRAVQKGARFIQDPHSLDVIPPAHGILDESRAEAHATAGEGLSPGEVIGHVMADLNEPNKGMLGRTRSTSCSILFSRDRLLLIKETWAMNDVGLQESERLYREAKESGTPWRTLMDGYRWNNPRWEHYYITTTDELLAENRWNSAIPTHDIRLAVVGLDPEDDLDHLKLHLVSGEELTFDLYLAPGRTVARYLTHILGSSRTIVEHRQA